MYDTVPATASVPAVATSGDGGALYLVFTQVASRAFTFLGNQFLLHYLSPSLLGLAVQLEVLSVTILYFARESLRVALQRQPPEENKHQTRLSRSQDAVNLAYLAITVGLLASVGFGCGYLRSSSDEVLDSVHFWLAFKLYAFSTFIELSAEPCFVIIQQHALYQARARAETAAALARCASACLTAVAMHARRSQASVLPFAVGQLFYSIALFAAYVAAILPLKQAEDFSMFPRNVQKAEARDTTSDYLWGTFSKSLLSLITTFYAQSVFKVLLTQGDSLVLSFLTDLKSQGAFALASNYGGLLSRLIFQPVEESSRNVFGRLLAPTDINEKENLTHASARPTSISAGAFSKALSHLTTILHVYTLLTLPLLSILPPILPPLTTLILRPQWRTPETTSLLRVYLYYIPFLALNGVLDAFVTSVATPKQLRTQNLIMAGVTGIYGVVAWSLMGTAEGANRARGWLSLFWGGGTEALGSTGLVYANIVNMALRIAYSVWFISGWVGKSEGGSPDVVRKMWRRSFPNASVAIIAIAAGGGLRSILRNEVEGKLVTKSFLGLNNLSFEDVGYVLGGAAVLGSSIIVFEYRFLLDLLLPLLPKRLTTKIAPYLPKSTVKQE